MTARKPLIRSSTLRAWVIAIAVFFIAMYFLRGVLLPFVAGFALAYFLDPLADKLQDAGMRRVPAVVTISLAFVLVMVGATVVLIPVVQAQVGALIENAPGYADRTWQSLRPHIDWLIAHLPEEQVKSMESSVGNVAGGVVDWLGGFAKGLLRQSFAVINVLSLVIITPVVAFYLLRDWDHMVVRVNSWLPRAHAPLIRDMARDIDRTLAGFLRGQATVCLALGLIYGIGLSIVGLDAGIVVGIGAGLLSFIPYVGTISGFVVAMILGLVQFTAWEPIAGIVAVFVVGQSLEGYVLTPRLVGDKVGLHPVWVMFSLLAGGTLFGFFGILVAVPVAAVIGVLVRYGLRHYLASPTYSDEPPPQ